MTLRSARYRSRLPLLALGMTALLAGLWGGLLRLGWRLPLVDSSLAPLHGPLMVSGFLGTLIGMERAVALGRRWAYAAPLLTGLGAVALIAGVPGRTGPLLMTAGSVGLVAIFGAILRRQSAFFIAVMALGAGAWLTGQILWLTGWPLYRVVFWWAGFLVLTIAGERLELARLVRVSELSRAVFLVAVGLFLLALALTVIDFNAGVRLLGLSLIALALWLMCQDIARRTVRQAGLPRFIALCLLSGYVWLGLSGVLAALSGAVTAGPRYDAVLHALFLGFVFAMIFGHAPIVLPAVLGKAVSFRPAFYAHLMLLHLSLVLRIAGDLIPWFPGRRWGGLFNVLALLFFFANTGYGALVPAVPRLPGTESLSRRHVSAES